MNSEIVITLFSSGLQAILAYWGYKLTVDPIETPQQRRWYRAGFIIIGIVGVALTVTQQWLNGREQAELLAKIDGVGTGVDQVRTQTQQPPSVTVNVPPIQVLSQTAPIMPRGPLPTFRLTDEAFPRAFNDYWFDVAGYRVRLDWRDLTGIDVYAEIDVWAQECGPSSGAKARIFDLTADSPVVEGALVNPVPDKTHSYNPLLWCKPVAQRLKIPRATGVHVYVLQASPETAAGMATARGQIVLERQ